MLCLQCFHRVEINAKFRNRETDLKSHFDFILNPFLHGWCKLLNVCLNCVYVNALEQKKIEFKPRLLSLKTHALMIWEKKKYLFGKNQDVDFLKLLMICSMIIWGAWHMHAYHTIAEMEWRHNFVLNICPLNNGLQVYPLNPIPRKWPHY